MASVQHGIWRRLSDLGIGMLILSLVHVPLPQADYHNIRHHDAPGEICGYHDHLLRWHPSADRNDDVSMLHWHWFVPIVEFGDHLQGPDDEHHGPGPGPSVHAQLGDWPAPDWHGEPVIQPDARGRSLDRLIIGQAEASSAHMHANFDMPGPRSGLFCSRENDFAGSLRASRGALFQRWNC